MIAYRQWWVAQDGQRPVLRSIVMRSHWPTATKAADELPREDNDHGIYAFLPHAESPLLKPAGVLVLGAIDAYGVIRVHTDDVVRSQFARILALRAEPTECGHDTVAVLDGLYVYACRCYWDAATLAKMGKRRWKLGALEASLLERYGVPRLERHPWEEA